MSREIIGEIAAVSRARHQLRVTDVGGATVRPARGDDAAKCFELFTKHLEWIRTWFPKEQMVDRTTTLTRIDHHLSNCPGAVAECNGQIVGFIASQLAEPDTSNISNLFVDDAYRNRGIGGELVKSYERLALHDGYTAVYATSSELYFPGKNAPRVFFARLGYDVIQITEQTEMYIKRNLTGLRIATASQA